jgi:hypothetical protein
MAKKRAAKGRTIKEKTAGEKAPRIKAEDPVITLLLENSVVLQKNLLALNERLDTLTTHIADLLKLFELAAKNIAEKPELGFEKEFLDKLNLLLEQNKLLARGITLISQGPMAAMPQLPTTRPAYQPMPPPRPGMAAPAMPVAESRAPMAEPSEEYTASGYTAGLPATQPKPKPQA